MTITRRLLLLLPLAVALRADSAHDVANLVTNAAEGLSEGKPEVFLEAFDPAMPGYRKLSDAVTALLDAAQIECSIEVTSNQGDDAERTLELDWILRIDESAAGAATSHRQQTVKCRLKKNGKKWRIVALEPIEFFRPPKA
jgi:hypothetical protein